MISNNYEVLLYFVTSTALLTYILCVLAVSFLIIKDGPTPFLSRIFKYNLFRFKTYNFDYSLESRPLVFHI